MVNATIWRCNFSWEYYNIDMPINAIVWAQIRHEKH